MLKQRIFSLNCHKRITNKIADAFIQGLKSNEGVHSYVRETEIQG